MQYRLLDSLGFNDAAKCNRDFGASLPIEKTALAKGDVIDLPPKAAEYLTGKFKALLEPASKIKGEAKEAEIKAPAK